MNNLPANYITLSPEEQLILGAVRVHAGSDDIESLRHIIDLILDWNRTLELADMHNIKPLVSALLMNPTLCSYLPDKIRSKLKMNTYAVMRNHLDYRSWFNHIFSSLDKIDVSPIVMKGHTFAVRYYDEPHLRASVDLDLLLKPDEILKVWGLLMDMGYLPENHTSGDHSQPVIDSADNEELHIAFFKNEKRFTRIIELHWRPAPGRLGYVDLADVWNQVCYMKIDNLNVPVPSETHQLVFSILHMIHHGWGMGSLKNMLDISLLIRKQKTIDWSLFCRYIKALNCRGFAYHILKWVNSDIGVKVPESVFLDLKPEPREAWCSNPPRKFDEVLALRDIAGIRRKAQYLLRELGIFRSYGDKFMFLLGVVFPPGEVVSQRLGVPSRWELYVNLLARPLVMLWRIICSKSGSTT